MDLPWPQKLRSGVYGKSRNSWISKRESYFMFMLTGDHLYVKHIYTMLNIYKLL
jgi:hypothetical protein